MGRYAYKARDAEGQPFRGVLAAESDLELANRLAKAGFVLTQAEAVSPEYPDVSGSGSSSRRPTMRLKPREVLILTTHLATFIKAGLSLLDGLTSIGQEERRGRIRTLMEDLVRRIQSGASLKEALAAYPRSFSPLYLALVGTGETTGKLEAILENLVGILEWELDLKARIRDAATYPLLLLTAMVAVVALLLVTVIPVFAPIFAEAGVELPLPTRLLLAASRMLQQGWPLALGLTGLVATAYHLAYRAHAGAILLDRLKLRIPLFGILLHKIVLSRFFYTFRISLSAGIDAVQSLRLSREVAGNAWMNRAIAEAERAIRVGQDLHTALAHTKAFPGLVLRMVAAGEQSGALVQCIEKVNQFYDREIPATLKRMFTVFEPLMLILMGVVVGGIALCLFLPLFRMAGVLATN